MTRQNALERHDATRMPLSRAINYAHPPASNFFENLIIAQQPICVVTMNLAEQLIQRWLVRGMLAVDVNTRGEKTLQTKSATNARCRPAVCAVARFILEMQRKGTGGRRHRGDRDHNASF